MRKAAALTLVVAALGSAAYLGSLRLDSHGNYPICLEYQGGLLRPACALATRGGWQLPVAVAIAGVGLLGAIGVVSRAQSKPRRTEG
jgi:hypothetical protein